MTKVNGLFQDRKEADFEKAYAQHLKDNKPSEQMSETDFYEDFIHKSVGYGQVGRL
jgi:hypothetical protein